jgi:hypothetical protein
MAGSENTAYYLQKKAMIMRGFDLTVSLQKRSLAPRFDGAKIDGWLAQSRAMLESLIPQFPYIGGAENEFTKYLVRPSMLIPLVRILRDEGVPARQVGQIIYEMVAVGYDFIPAPLRWWQARVCFSEKKKAQWRRTARQTQSRRYPGDWVCKYVEGDGETFEYGLDVTECGLLKFWHAQGVKEFVPYLCLTDWALWQSLGIEVKRTQTLANGGDCCDYRYIGRSKDVSGGWPPESKPEWTAQIEL